MQEITFVTSHPTKAKQLGLHLGIPVVHKGLDLKEIQSLDLDEVAMEKAREAYRQVGGPVLVEDYSLCFLALGKLPGPLIKWFLEELEMSQICQLLDDYEDRSAVARVAFAFFDGSEGEGPHIFTGEIRGSIAMSPRGTEDFGSHRIFIPDGHTKTWGEMSQDEQNKTSTRRIALKKLEKFLRERG